MCRRGESDAGRAQHRFWAPDVVDGKEMHQSMAQLRYVASLGDGSLLPKDPMDAYKVELMVEMCNDFAAAWRPCLYISMRPHL